MGNRVTLEVRGLRDLDDALRAFPVEIKRSPIIYRALHDGARIVVAEAKRLAPTLQDTNNPRRRAGVLRANITQMADKKVAFSVVIRVRNRGWIFGDRSRLHLTESPSYWWFVEFGTSKMAAHPFLRPAFESKKQAAATAIQLSLLKGVAFVADKLGIKIAA